MALDAGGPGAHRSPCEISCFRHKLRSRRRLGSIRRTSRRRFSVAVSDYVITVFLADALRNVQRLAPHIAFELVPTSERAVEALEAGTLDFLIAPEVFVSKRHPKVPLFEDTHTVIAWTRNRNVGRRISSSSTSALVTSLSTSVTEPHRTSTSCFSDA